MKHTRALFVASVLASLLGIVGEVATANVGCNPTIDPNTFGSANPVAFSPTDATSVKNGTINLRDFSSALTREELADRLFHLPVTDEIRKILVDCAATQYPLFISAHEKVVSRHADRYFEMCGNLVIQREITGMQPSSQEFLRQIQEAESIQAELINTEIGFIDAMRQCLKQSKAFRGNSKEIKNFNVKILNSLTHRAHFRYSELDTNRIQRGTNVDLRNLIDQLEMELPDRVKLEEDLLNYERAMASLKPAHSKAFWNRAPKMRVILDQSDAGTIDTTSFRTQCNMIISAFTKIGVQIRNEALYASSKISAKLPSDKKLLFETAVHNAMFPELIDDKLGESLRSEFTSALARTDLSIDIVARISTLQQSWKSELDVWTATAETTLVEWSDGASGGGRQFDLEFQQSMLAELLKKRAILHDTWRVLLADQLPSHVK